MTAPSGGRPLDEVVAEMVVKVEVLVNEIGWLKRIGMVIVTGLLGNLIVELVRGLK